MKGIEKVFDSPVPPRYVVLSPTLSDRTVILHLMTHDSSLVEHTQENRTDIDTSSKNMNTSLSYLKEKNVISEVYVEGVMYKKDDSGLEFGKLLKDYPSAQKKYGIEGLKHKGFEEVALSNIPGGRLTMGGPEVTGQVLFFRSTIENIFLAMNVKAQLLKASGNVQAVSIGSLHEDGQKLGKRLPGLSEHPLPIAKVLAAMGINVVVVDTTQQ